MKAIILAIGDELVRGVTVDTNSAALARRLGELGIPVAAFGVLGDDEDAIVQAITAAAGQADMVLVTGGLGPTADDVTRQALAKAMGVELVLEQERLAEIEAFFRRRGREMQPGNRVQAMVPAGARSLSNPLGTAPGIAAEVGNARVYALPGVPSEMERMFADSIAPHLSGHDGTIVHRLVHCFGAGESDVAARITDLMQRGRNPTVGTTAASGMITVRVVARGTDRRQAQDLAERTVSEIRSRLGELVVGVDEHTLPGTVGEQLRRAGATLATAESCTGGLIGELVTSVPGASDYYLGGMVAYADDAKRGLLGVAAETIRRHGAVSEEVAAAMADGVRRRLSATWALSATGIAGPTGGSDAKPVGLVYIGLAGPEGIEVTRHVLPGTRGIVRLRSALTALNRLRLALMG